MILWHQYFLHKQQSKNYIRTIFYDIYSLETFQKFDFTCLLNVSKRFWILLPIKGKYLNQRCVVVFSNYCFVHPIFGFWSPLATKLRKYYVMFVYILQGKCDNYLHHWRLGSSRLESLLMTAATTILLFLDFLLKNDIVILAFFEKK